jgi:hypothetical protein
MAFDPVRGMSAYVLGAKVPGLSVRQTHPYAANESVPSRGGDA